MLSPSTCGEARVAPAWSVQTGEVHHGGARLGRACTRPSWSPCVGRGEVLEQQRELTGARPHRGEVAARHRDGHRRGELGVEGHLAAVGAGQHLAGAGVRGRAAWPAASRRRPAPDDRDPVAGTDLAGADRLDRHAPRPVSPSASLSQADVSSLRAVHTTSAVIAHHPGLAGSPSNRAGSRTRLQASTTGTSSLGVAPCRMTLSAPAVELVADPRGAGRRPSRSRPRPASAPGSPRRAGSVSCSVVPTASKAPG